MRTTLERVVSLYLSIFEVRVFIFFQDFSLITNIDCLQVFVQVVLILLLIRHDVLQLNSVMQKERDERKLCLSSYHKCLALSSAELGKQLIVPTFDTKVTEYLCSGWVFFSSDKFRLFN